jgi:hypothetical protein
MESAEVIVKGYGYERLPEGLLPYLTEKQRKRIYAYSKRENVWIVNGQSVVKCFQFINETHLEFATQCVCGVEIYKVYEVVNIEDPTKQAIIGCECIKNWHDIVLGYHCCTFCGMKRKNNKDCKNCKPKQELRKSESIRDIFEAWRSAAYDSAMDKMPCGKYKHCSIKYVHETDRRYFNWFYTNVVVPKAEYDDKYFVYYALMKNMAR